MILIYAYFLFVAFVSYVVYKFIGKKVPFIYLLPFILTLLAFPVVVFGFFFGLTGSNPSHFAIMIIGYVIFAVSSVVILFWRKAVVACGVGFAIFGLGWGLNSLFWYQHNKQMNSRSAREVAEERELNRPLPDTENVRFATGRYEDILKSIVNSSKPGDLNYTNQLGAVRNCLVSEDGNSERVSFYAKKIRDRYVRTDNEKQRYEAYWVAQRVPKEQVFILDPLPVADRIFDCAYLKKNN